MRDNVVKFPDKKKIAVTEAFEYLRNDPSYDFDALESMEYDKGFCNFYTSLSVDKDFHHFLFMSDAIREAFDECEFDYKFIIMIDEIGVKRCVMDKDGGIG